VVFPNSIGARCQAPKPPDRWKQTHGLLDDRPRYRKLRKIIGLRLVISAKNAAQLASDLFRDRRVLGKEMPAHVRAAAEVSCPAKGIVITSSRTCRGSIPVAPSPCASSSNSENIVA